MKFRPLFLFTSLVLIGISIFSIVSWGFRPSIDFAGGTAYEFELPSADKNQIETVFKQNSIKLNSISQKQNNFLLKFENISQEKKVVLESELKKINPQFNELKFESMGPVLGKELLKKTITAVILSSIALMIFIGSRFNDFSFGASAVLAMLHDSLILLGAFSLFGHFFGAELDSLFITALLTTLSASVHDTVVTFDRIRELKRLSFQSDWVELANRAVSEVIVRSINNSMTIIFMLTSLVALGGATTRWFAVALLVGVVSGTYSSTAVAIPLVLLWKRRVKK